MTLNYLFWVAVGFGLAIYHSQPELMPLFVIAGILDSISGKMR